MKIVVRFIASRSVIGWLIRFGTMSLFEHVECLSRDGQGWVGAHAWTGVEKRPLDWAGKLIRDYRYELEVTEAQFEAFHEFIEGMEGTRYNYMLIAGVWRFICGGWRCGQGSAWTALSWSSGRSRRQGFSH